jgi:hypothetical protein
MIPSNSLQVQQCWPSTTEDKNIEPSWVVEMDFDIVPYPLSPTEVERQERANITKRFGDAWPTPSYYFRPIDDASTLLSEMDDDDALSIASDEVISIDIFSQTAVLQQSTTTDDNIISFVNVIGLEAEDHSDQDSKNSNK